MCVKRTVGTPALAPQEPCKPGLVLIKRAHLAQNQFMEPSRDRDRDIARVVAGRRIWRQRMRRWLLPVCCSTLMVASILFVRPPDRLSAQSPKPSFVVIERLTTTGPESIQEQYGKVSRDIVAKFGGRYLARSQNNALLEGESVAPCCIAILQFPSTQAAKD